MLTNVHDGVHIPQKDALLGSLGRSYKPDYSIATNHEKLADVLAVWSTGFMAVRQLIPFSN
jgi:hypothetical protein